MQESMMLQYLEAKELQLEIEYDSHTGRKVAIENCFVPGEDEEMSREHWIFTQLEEQFLKLFMEIGPEAHQKALDCARRYAPQGLGR